MREGSPAARADQKREGERNISIKSYSESLRQKQWRGKKTSLSDASFTQAWKWICLFVKQLCASIHAIDSYFNQHHKAIPLFSLSHSVIGAMLMTSAVISDFLLIFIRQWPEQSEVELWDLQHRAPICPDSILIWIIRKISDSKATLIGCGALANPRNMLTGSQRSLCFCASLKVVEGWRFQDSLRMVI